jgi:hypothetical protein
MRDLPEKYFQNDNISKLYGITNDQINKTIHYTYNVLDSIDEKLIEANTDKFSQLVELANLSAMIGNLFRSGLIKNTNGLFKENAPHAFPDLICSNKEFKDLEIKVALETNKPKGHLVKPGSHLIIRYSLCNMDAKYSIGKENRGDTAWIWQICIGELLSSHFSVSNTDGDSGKTAVITQDGMNNLETIFFDPRFFPYSKKGKVFDRFSKYYYF